MSPFDKMKAKESAFTKKEKIVYELLRDNPDEILRGDINTWSAKHNISQSTLTRFCQKIGYDGFNEFKFDYFRYEKTGANVESNENHDILDYYSSLTLSLREFVSKKELTALAKSIKEADNIIVYGTHKSSLPAQMLKLNLLKLSKHATFIESSTFQEIQHFITEKDLLIIFTATGGSIDAHCKQILSTIQKNNKLNLAIVTFNEKLPLKSKSNHFIWLPSSINQHYKVYLENQIVFFIYIDLLTSELARII
ncbi:MAG: MurR/RpiR family transcriptional regulator [Coprobacillaceae bacterium]